MSQLLRLAALTIALAGTVFAADPIIGTWKLNLKESKYNPGPAPRSQIRTYQQTANGIRTVVTTVTSKGTTTKSEYAANVDGKEYPVTGQPDVDSLRLVKVDDHTSEAKLIHADHVLATVLRTLSTDGKSMTIAYQGRDSYGDPVQYTAVFDKQ